MRVANLVAGLLEWPDGTRRLVVLFCVAVTVGAAGSTPPVFVDVNQQARSNASLDYVDRELGAGNSVFPDQQSLLEARGWIPEDATFAVAVGEPQAGWSELAVPGVIDTYLRYFLLPRRRSGRPVDPLPRVRPGPYRGAKRSGRTTRGSRF